MMNQLSSGLWRLARMEADGGAGGGAGSGSGDAGEGTGELDGGSGGSGGGSGERTFSQADVDRIVQDRLARDRRDRPAEQQIEEWRTKATQWDEQSAASKTELELEREARAKAEADAQKATQTANARLIQAEVLAEATAQRALKPEHLHRLVDLDGVTVGDDGSVTGVKEAVKAFLDANPEYVGTTGRATGSADQGARGAGNGVKQLTRDDLARMTSAEITKAEAEGRLVDLMTGKA